MNKEYIYNIIDNKIEYFDLSDYIRKTNFSTDFHDLVNALKINKSINTLELSMNLGGISFGLTPLLTQISTFINTKTNITTLKISYTDLTLKDLYPLFDTLQSNTSIKTLDLSNNKIDNFLDKKYYDILKNIEKIKLYYNNINKLCDLEKNVKINYNQFLKTMYDQLNLTKNDLIKNNSFFNMLLKNKTITTLNLANNKTSNSKLYCYDNEINILSDILQQNKTIKTLNLNYRYYSIKNIIEFIKNNNCIEKLILFLESSKNTKANIELLRKYYNENEYLQEIVII